MRRFAAPCIVVAAVVVPSVAAAHSGAVVAKAVFCAPAGPDQTPGDGGVVYSYTPRWAAAEADQHYVFRWQDGDMDPTGKFTFFYIDHDVPSSVDVGFVDGTGPSGQGIGRIVKAIDGREARDIYVSCACVAEDAGADACDAGTIPNCADGGPRWCDNEVDWDTSQVPDGVYWIAAVNNDPPYHVYNMSDAPIRVAHGAHKPPAVMVVHPDGLGGGADRASRIVLLVDPGQPGATLTLDLAWGIDLATSVGAPTHAIASKVPLALSPDGTATFDWDVSALDDNVYFVEATVTDEMGASSYSDSRYGVSVFHKTSPADMRAPGPRDLGSAPDLAEEQAPPTGSCHCALARRAGGPGAFPVAAAVALALALATRRRGRRGSRSACRS